MGLQRRKTEPKCARSWAHVGGEGCGTISGVIAPNLNLLSGRRRALWLFAAALLLKAATPMLASVSAHQQDKTLVKLCTDSVVASVVRSRFARFGPRPTDSPFGRYACTTCQAAS